MHNKISLWFIFSDNIEYILKNIYIMKEITDDIHIYARNRIMNKGVIDILNKYNVKISYKSSECIKCIFEKSKYSWSIIVENNANLTSKDIEEIHKSIGFNNECAKKDKYAILKVT